MNRPHIMILTSGPDEVLREICAGIEEEGVPFVILPGPPLGALELALRAAQRSPLQVGIGSSADGVRATTRAKTSTGSGCSANCTVPSSRRRWKKLSALASGDCLTSSATSRSTPSSAAISRVTRSPAPAR